MSVADVFAEPDTTREAIMHATYVALCEHGYADLTIQRIADEFPKSKSLLYHHYDDKDDLLLSFLQYMLDEFQTGVPEPEYATAREQLQGVLDHILPDELEPDREAFLAAMIELRAQAAHDPDYRAYFSRHDAFFCDRLRTIIDRGIAEEVFRPVDPEPVAEVVLTIIEGAMLRRSTAQLDDALPTLRAEIDAYIDQRLHAKDPTR